MGFKREILRAAYGSVLLLSASVAAAQPPEPLIISKLPEQELVVTRSALAEQRPSIDDAMDRFGEAIGQAIEVEQQAIKAACKSTQNRKPGTPAAYDWRARCSYQRY
jgi:hypothetical protein